MVVDAPVSRWGTASAAAPFRGNEVASVNFRMHPGEPLRGRRGPGTPIQRSLVDATHGDDDLPDP